jgi:4-amino-4-deoxy-L-arabinose transferase-like glycosyltransferase
MAENILVFPDSIGYVYPAQTWLSYGHMWEAVSASPMLLRTPGYPFFLALIQFLTGNMTWAVAIVQNILSLVLLIPVYLSAHLLSGRGAARWATAFCALSVLYFSLSFAVLTEILCTFLLAWFIFFIIRFLVTPRWVDLFVASLCLASAVYVRPAAYYFMVLSAGLLCCFCLNNWLRFPLSKIALYFILPLVLTIGGWHIRNACLSDYKGFTSVGAYNLYIWNEDYIAKKFNIPTAEARTRLELALPTGFSALSPAEQVRLYRALAKPLIQESFLYKLSRTPWWATKTLLGANNTQLQQLFSFQKPSFFLFLIAEGEIFCMVFLACVGFGILWKKDRKTAFFLGTYCLYFWVIASFFSGAYARFRAPFEFVLCISAGTAVWHWIEKYQKSL